MLLTSRSKVRLLCVSGHCQLSAALPPARRNPTTTPIATPTAIATPIAMPVPPVPPLPAGLSAVSAALCPRVLAGFPSCGVRWASGSTAAAAAAPGSTAVAAAPGWFGGLADSLPVQAAEQLLLGVQQSSGLPWWAGIMVTTLAVRTLVTLPLAAYQQVIIAKVEALQPEISALARRVRHAVSERGRERGWSDTQCRLQFKQHLRRQVSHLYVRENCHPFKASLLVWVQLPVWVSLSVALRNLSVGSAHSGLQAELAAGGALWFPDLTLPDSTWILPVCLGITNLLIVEIFSLQKLEVSRFRRFVTNSVRGFSLLMIPIAATVPSCVCVYWLTSSLLGLAHNLVLRSPALRRRCGLPPGSASPYRDLLTAFTNKHLK
ncbi:cytochrome c oxidase assembly protein COX18, mitochondrial [Myripristis murdjan]|uniref:Cytochrome c oxidase assembly factor COX18 n=1 Tax=Myripristis murdjan TaxID=586833 RepID=A0A667YVS1_9TELE|nr:cytochrome c oxidase assembly protein COX18, mitochondrial [Myripristis murdjan]